MWLKKFVLHVLSFVFGLPGNPSVPLKKGRDEILLKLTIKNYYKKNNYTNQCLGPNETTPTK